MENIFVIIVGILFILAISDLIVGVSNDAVNFLNSAIGAKAAPFWVIMIIASLGVLVGATFSNGMMEVARKGIFHPEYFYFSEIMILFLAVMLTDVILLDTFNALGLPTSTTVSIVFELLGAAVALAVIKVKQLGLGIDEIGTYINSSKALAIISGILLSVVVAFIAGAIIQYITRIIFSFNFKKYTKYFGSLWGGIAITAITYFLLIKGAKGSSFIDAEILNWIKSNTFMIIVYSFLGWTIILQILSWIFRFDILRMTVLLGTFALAMAFAGNDLVNFIGVPLAGLKSYQAFVANPGADPNAFAMVALTGKVKTETVLLIIAGFIMVITLWLSRKARRVTATTLDLSRQDEGQERFHSSGFSRSLVRGAMKINNAVQFIVPKRVIAGIESRFDRSFEKEEGKDAALSFDMVRASVNLVVASILISFATSLKLPLSTTYVTFMVAMGTSLADGAWGRESAVYRITGVITVVGGWFFTALVAFSAAFVIAFIIHLGGTIAIFILILIAISLIYRTHILFRKREAEKLKHSSDNLVNIENENILDKCTNSVNSIIIRSLDAYSETIKGLIKENRKKLKTNLKTIRDLTDDTKYLKDSMHSTIHDLKSDSIESGHHYVQVLDYLRELVHSISFITRPVFDHIDNNHKGLVNDQVSELNKLNNDIRDFILETKSIIEDKDFSKVDSAIQLQQKVLDEISSLRKSQIKRIKKDAAGTKNSILYLNILSESKNYVLYSLNLLKSYRDFAIDNNKTTEK
jgi:phosphate/sulfate permease